MAQMSKKPWRQVIASTWHLIHFDGKELGYVAIYTLVLGIISVAVPFASQILVNQTAFTGAVTPIVMLSMIVLGVLIIGVGTRLFQLRVLELIKTRIFVRIGFTSANALLRKHKGPIDREISNRFFEISTLQTDFASILTEGLGALAVISFGVVLLALYHPFLFAFCLVLICGCLLTILPFSRASIESLYEKSNHKYRTAHWLSEVAEHRNLLQYGPTDHFIWDLTNSRIERYVVSQLKYLRVFLIQAGGLSIVRAIGTSAFLGLGGWLVLIGQLNMGQFVAAEIVILSVLSSLGKFDKFLDSAYDCIVATQKIAQLIDPDSSEQEEIVSTVPFAALQIQSKALASPVKIPRGHIVRIQSKSKTFGSQFLVALAGAPHLPNHTGSILSDLTVSANGEELPQKIRHHIMLYLSSAAALRMSIGQNLTLLMPADAHADGGQKSFTLPDLKSLKEWKDGFHKILEPSQMLAAQKAKISILRCFFDTREIQLIDQFFDDVETEDQIQFLTEYRQKYPDRILIIHSRSSELDKLFDQVLETKS